MIDVRNKHITVVGAARSGLAAARMLAGRGATVYVSDASPIQPGVKSALDRDGIPWEERGHTERAKQADMAVVSPGVPDDTPIMTHYRKTGIPVYSELEAASWFNRSPVVAVTGSNGKTTVARWMEHTWKTAGRACLTGGNIGRPFSDIIDETGAGRTTILEVSSFQLDHILGFRPDVSVILNITPDHLDRYEYSFERYIESKLRIAANQRTEDILILNSDDPVLSEKADLLKKRKAHPRILSYSINSEVERGAFIRDQKIIFKINDTNDTEELFMHSGDVGLPGKHNLSNSLATALAARVSEIKSESIRESLKTFGGVEHRLELVSELNGVRYINDSKATNINAVWFALDSYRMPVVLIMGGRDKGNDYLALKEQITEKVHTIIALGEARPGIKKQLGNVVPDFFEAETLEEAVQLACKKAKRGEIVLLSPACSSFDMFENYEQRGDAFKNAVRELAT
ncbi:MAG: UDP-N-acetylmuramoyl-L-alanine--D-glutamate ligase [Balneolaceae bacterium]